MAETPESSFFARNEFLIRRLHSLSGLIPVGAYLVIHLLTNASIVDSSDTYQRLVFGIHSLGAFLPVVEWVFIFIPLLFHAVVGIVIVAGGVPNTQSYPLGGNFRYTMMRATGMIAFVFIMWHVFHMHGWFHFDWWLNNVATPLAGHQFRPFNASSSLGMAMQGTGAIIVNILYIIGMLSCVWHFSNGLWTMGITWGMWISQAAQNRAKRIADVVFVVLAIVGLTAVYGAATVNIDQAKVREDEMYEAKVEAGDIKADEHKRTGHEAGKEQASKINTPTPKAPNTQEKNSEH